MDVMVESAKIPTIGKVSFAAQTSASFDIYREWEQVKAIPNLFASLSHSPRNSNELITN